MVRNRNTVPLDYGLCCMTVTVYHREGERSERCQRQMKRAERVAAVGR